MVGITGRAVTGDLTVNSRPTRLCVFESFHDQDTGTFAHNKAIAALVEGATRRTGIVIVTGAHRFHRTKTSITQFRDGGFTATREHEVGLAVTEHMEGFADTVRARGTSADNAEVGTTGTHFDCNDTASDVCNKRGNHERGHFTGAAFVESATLSLNRNHPADTRTDEHTEAIRVQLGGVFQTGIFERKTRGGDGKLSVAVVATSLLGVHVLSGIKMQAL